MGAAVVRGEKFALEIINRQRPLRPLNLEDRPGRKITRLAEEKLVVVGHVACLHVRRMDRGKGAGGQGGGGGAVMDLQVLTIRDIKLPVSVPFKIF